MNTSSIYDQQQPLFQSSAEEGTMTAAPQQQPCQQQPPQLLFATTSMGTAAGGGGTAPQQQYFYYPTATGGDAVKEKPFYQSAPYSSQQKQQGPGKPPLDGANPFGFKKVPAFKHSLFGCLDNPILCCEAILCAYCQVASQFNMVKNNIPDVNWNMCGVMAVCDLCCAGFGIGLYLGTTVTRWKIRERFNITPDGTESEDLAIACCCNSCAIVQQHREMTSFGEYPGGMILGDESPPTSAPQQQESEMR